MPRNKVDTDVESEIIKEEDGLDGGLGLGRTNLCHLCFVSCHMNPPCANALPDNESAPCLKLVSNPATSNLIDPQGHGGGTDSSV